MTARSFISGFSLFVGTALLGSPITASAAEPATAAEARVAAARSRAQADHYRTFGGVAYKTGLVQRAELEAAQYDARARELSGASTAPQPAPADDRANEPCVPEKPSIRCDE